MSSADRKAAIDAYKQRKVVGGIYAVTCLATGERWVGAANDLSNVKNRIWFSLGLGRSPWKGLQAAWQAHGPEQFTFAEMERLADDLAPYAKELALKDRLTHWQQELQAATI
jgi:hypothetical protein